ncbi:hypothetical protein KPL70_021445 [Citrus sinensis]|uniref:DUF7731 domain-containing protein n=1 Tax=Citrus clementina TaxID=85681 RepID=V4SWX3_CITCL|nr:hypothetical protein CICLE_v10003504mg [Citrus x clementina]KAH9668526.1 hypothetical protein KPL70_021445 [Citrus sinensis]
METYSLLGRILCLSMGIFLLLTSAFAKSEGNVNLSPFRAWRSAYECLFYGANPCSAKDKLTMDGAINVPVEETKDYCREGGCGEHIQNVLKCIHLVKRDFWFANKAPVKFLQDAISTGCNTSTEINTTDYPISNAIKMYQSFSKSLTLALSTVLFMVVFNI